MPATLSLRRHWGSSAGFTVFHSSLPLMITCHCRGRLLEPGTPPRETGSILGVWNLLVAHLSIAMQRAVVRTQRELISEPEQKCRNPFRVGNWKLTMAGQVPGRTLVLPTICDIPPWLEAKGRLPQMPLEKDTWSGLPVKPHVGLQSSYMPHAEKLSCPSELTPLFPREQLLGSRTQVLGDVTDVPLAWNIRCQCL